MAESESDIAARRHELIRVMRGGSNKAFGDAVDKADADDLEWFLARIDAQLGETPYWVADQDDLAKFMAELRHQRIVVAGVLGTKKTVEKRAGERSAKIRANIGIGIAMVAVLIALWAAIFK